MQSHLADKFGTKRCKYDLGNVCPSGLCFKTVDQAILAWSP